MNKKKVGIKIIIGMFIILIVVGLYLINKVNPDDKKDEELECISDKDCIPASCCHPDSCVPASKSPNCAGIYCTAVCEPGTLDCGQGSCGCVKNNCQVIFK